MGKQLPIVSYLRLDDPPVLVAQACDACGARFFDRRNACAGCFGTEFHEAEIPTTGVLRTFTIVHRAAPGVTVPFVSATAVLDDGSAVKANLVDVDPDPDQIRPGAPVELSTWIHGTDDEGTEAVAFGFRPTKGGAER
ncbi:MAG: Zn-ribbon domain-containing OB-fold protein [Acidimicrobiales bacterium]